jgi:hypothetical protein
LVFLAAALGEKFDKLRLVPIAPWNHAFPSRTGP